MRLLYSTYSIFHLSEKVQADLTDEEATQFGWVFVDNGFTFLFVIEAILRFYYVRWRVVLEPWLLFDLILVLISVFDVWISVVAGTEGAKSNGLRMLSVFLMFRVLLTGSATDVLGSRGTANRGSWQWERASTPRPDDPLPQRFPRPSAGSSLENPSPPRVFVVRESPAPRGFVVRESLAPRGLP